LPGVDGYAKGRAYTSIPNPVAQRTHACADRLQDKCNPICPFHIGATQKNAKLKIKGVGKINLVLVPERAGLPKIILGKCIAITVVL
jgi:hypothetical protein